MSIPICKPGDKFCRLTLVSVFCGGPHQIWNCICECGTECTARIDKLKSGRKKSCGCLKTELAEAAKKNKAERITDDWRIVREASYEKDKLKLKKLLKEKGEINFQHFEFTGTPHQTAKEFREWAFIVSAVLKYGPKDDSVNITADVKVGRLRE